MKNTYMKKIGIYYGHGSKLRSTIEVRKKKHVQYTSVPEMTSVYIMFPFFMANLMIPGRKKCTCVYKHVMDLLRNKSFFALLSIGIFDFTVIVSYRDVKRRVMRSIE